MDADAAPAGRRAFLLRLLVRVEVPEADHGR